MSLKYHRELILKQLSLEWQLFEITIENRRDVESLVNALYMELRNDNDGKVQARITPKGIEAIKRPQGSEADVFELTQDDLQAIAEHLEVAQAIEIPSEQDWGRLSNKIANLLDHVSGELANDDKPDEVLEIEGRYATRYEKETRWAQALEDCAFLLMFAQDAA